MRKLANNSARRQAASAPHTMLILISGGPGSGCTSTAAILSEQLGLPHFDSDSYFHKPTDPPFLEQYSPYERRELLGSALRSQTSWILSGSIATWGLDPFEPTHGIFLAVPKEVRLDRLTNRQRDQFGTRINPGGDMEEEHESFMEWAAGYETRSGSGRNSTTDHAFLSAHCGHLLEITDSRTMKDLISEIIGFLTSTRNDPH